MTIFITGINGFLGSALARRLTEHGHQVRGSSSNPAKAAAPNIGPVIAHRLGEEMASSHFQGVDGVVHCAHDFSPGALSQNIEGTENVVRAALEAGVRRQIYISSLSSRADAVTDYGRSKYQAELRIRSLDGVHILRPATIVGRGGLFGKMYNLVARAPLVPLFDGGKGAMYLIGLGDLMDTIERYMDLALLHKEINVYYEDTYRMVDVLLEMRRQIGRRVPFVPIPSGPAILAFQCIEALGIRLPVGSENLKGYVVSQKMIYASDLSLFRPGTAPTLESLLNENMKISPSST